VVELALPSTHGGAFPSPCLWSEVRPPARAASAFRLPPTPAPVPPSVGPSTFSHSHRARLRVRSAALPARPSKPVELSPDDARAEGRRPPLGRHELRRKKAFAIRPAALAGAFRLLETEVIALRCWLFWLGDYCLFCSSVQAVPPSLVLLAYSGVLWLCHGRLQFTFACGPCLDQLGPRRRRHVTTASR